MIVHGIHEILKKFLAKFWPSLYNNYSKTIQLCYNLKLLEISVPMLR